MHVFLYGSELKCYGRRFPSPHIIQVYRHKNRIVATSDLCFFRKRESNNNLNSWTTIKIWFQNCYFVYVTISDF